MDAGQSVPINSSIMKSASFILVLILCLVSDVTSILAPADRTKIDEMLSRDLSSPPVYSTGTTTDVSMSLIVTQMRFVSGNVADFTFYSYQIWTDERLQYQNLSNDTKDYHVVREKNFKNIWLVESYVENELHSRVHDSSIPNRFVWIFPNGTVVYGMRLTVGLACQLQHIGLPIGYFMCNLKYRIHSYAEKEVSLKWSETFPVVFTNGYDKSESATLKEWKFTTCDSDQSAVLASSCLQISVLVEQDYIRSIVRLYMPSIFVVFVGWLSFWVDRSEVSARIKLGTLCLLAMITEEVGIKFLLPDNIYFEAVEVWFSANLAFVLISIVEYTFVHAVDCYQEKWKKCHQVDVPLQKPTTFDNIDNENIKEITNIRFNEQHPDDFDRDKVTGYDLRQNSSEHPSYVLRFILWISTGKVEKYTRIVYSVLFVSFQAFYWTYYLNHYQYTVGIS